MLKLSTKVLVWGYVRRFGYKRFYLLGQDYEVPMKIFCDTKATISIVITQLNMIEQNMWRLIDTLLKKDRTMVAYTFLTFPQVNKLLIFSPMGFSDKVLTLVLARWVLLTFMFQLEVKC